MNQLRSANFFKKFSYDNQSANWLCANCAAIYLKAGHDRSAGAIEAAASHPEVELPFPSCKLTAEAAGYQDRAENAVGAALEAGGGSSRTRFEGIYLRCEGAACEIDDLHSRYNTAA